MSAPLRKPRIGDRVRVPGNAGTFEVIRVTESGTFADLKLFDSSNPRSEHIESNVPMGALLYLHSSGDDVDLESGYN
jgi:hypothetical protein